jgi:hypothetical protein
MWLPWLLAMISTRSFALRSSPRTSYHPHAPVLLAVMGPWAQVGHRFAGRNHIVNSLRNTFLGCSTKLSPSDSPVVQLLQLIRKVNGLLGIIL